MGFLHKTTSGWKSFWRKHRFTMSDVTDGSEEWRVHVSPASLCAAALAFVLTFFIVVLTLVAYTPVLEFLPGYRTEATRSRENLIRNIIRLDSMERMMNDMMTYNEHLALILDGRTPVERTVANADSSRTGKILVMPAPEDSLLRAEMEGHGPYALGQAASSRRAVREALELVAPVEGIVAEHFDIREGRFGVRIAAAADARIAAIDNGTVVMSLWAPETGYAVGIQHAGNLISIYTHMQESLVRAGQTVRGGEQIGANGEATASDDGTPHLFEFQLWNNGKPVDPEGYIVF